MMESEYITESERETMELAEEFAGELSSGNVVCLEGGLGVGKTQFVKGIAARLGIDPSQVHSPTYTLINEYPAILPIYHFDWYRIKSIEEALEIGAEEYFYGDGVSIVEWPERVRALIPDQAIWIEIDSLDRTRRKFKFGKKTN